MDDAVSPIRVAWVAGPLLLLRLCLPLASFPARFLAHISKQQPTAFLICQYRGKRPAALLKHKSVKGSAPLHSLPLGPPRSTEESKQVSNGLLITNQYVLSGTVLCNLLSNG